MPRSAAATALMSHWEIAALTTDAELRPWGVDEKLNGELEEEMQRYASTLIFTAPIKVGAAQGPLDQGKWSDEEEPDCTLPELTDAQKAEVRQFSDDWVTTGQCINMGYMDDFTTPCEKQLGRIMHAEHDSDFYIVDKFPLEVCTSMCFGTTSNLVPTFVFVFLLLRILAHLHWLQRRRVVYPLPPLLYPAHAGACGYNRPCAYM